MFNNQVRQRVRGLVAGLGPSIVSEPDRLEPKLADLASANPQEVQAMVAAARGGVAEEIAAAPPEHRAEMVEQAAAWMASETGLPTDLSRWAVESWNEALQGVQVAPAQSGPPAQPVAAAAAPASAPPAPWDSAPKPQGPGFAPPPLPGYGAPPAPGAWPPPAGYSGAAPSWANTSGTEGEVPPEIARLKWNWGAFAVSFWWLIFHGLWPVAVGLVALNAGLNYLPVNEGVRAAIVIAVYLTLGFMGNKLAWRHRSYENIDHFFAVERVWMYWGIGLTAFSVVFGISIFLLVFRSALP